MTDLPFIIVIPVYNNEKTIQKAINSYLKQETDITPDILTQYNNQTIKIVTLENKVPLIENYNMHIIILFFLYLYSIEKENLLILIFRKKRIRYVKV